MSSTKRHSPLHQAAGHQALPAESLLLVALETIHLQSGVRFIGEIEQLRGFALHSEGRFEGLDSSRQSRVALSRAEMAAVEELDQAQLQFLHSLTQGTPLQVGDGCFSRLDPNSLIHGREEVGTPDLLSCVRQLGCQDHEGREVLVEGTQSIAQPRTHGGTGEGDRAGVNSQAGLEVVIV